MNTVTFYTNSLSNYFYFIATIGGVKMRSNTYTNKKEKCLQSAEIVAKQLGVTVTIK